MMAGMSSPRVLLIVLDGYGRAPASATNAVTQAQTPFLRSLWESASQSQLAAHGLAVGLPEGVMGNSEVGHLTLGAGRVILTDLVRIDSSIRDGSFGTRARPWISHVGGRRHVLGLLSDAGVHSHLRHLLALLDACLEESSSSPVVVHPILDGRDSPPGSALDYLAQLSRHPSLIQGRAILGSVHGRYYAMDRDRRWDRILSSYQVLSGGQASLEISASEYVSGCLKNGLTDEFIVPQLLDPRGVITEQDAVLFLNFRSDRARELSQVLNAPKSSPEFCRLAFGGATPPDHYRPPCLWTMTQYGASGPQVEALFAPIELEHHLGEWLSLQGKRQLRIAETEKYAHVTFFFNGGREEPYPGEERRLVASTQNVSTYDQAPAMSCREIAELTQHSLEENVYDFVLLNFANPDMVGHTGVLDATCLGLEALDGALSRVVSTARRCGYQILITADHGNAEEMVDAQGRPHTQHTLNPVPIFWVGPTDGLTVHLREGQLSDVAPTVARFLGIPPAPEWTGQSLISM